MNKVLMLNSVRGFIGGVERLMVGLADTLRQEGWQVYGLFERSAYEDPVFDAAFDGVSVCSDRELESKIQDYRELGISHVMIHKSTKWQWIRMLCREFICIGLIHDHDYYCLRRHKYFPLRRINCHLPYNAFYCGLCSAVPDRSGRGMSRTERRQRVNCLEAMRELRHYFVLSDYMKQNLVMNGFDSGRISLLTPYQEAYEPAFAATNEAPQILYVGQLIRGKGVDLLIKALKGVSEPFSCKIVGRGNDEGYLRKLALELESSKRPVFTGWQAKPEELYRSSDIVVVPSRWQEPFGLVGLEAFAHGKPVVAFDVGGIGQWLKHEQNGLLVKPGDHAALAQAITRILKDKDLRSSLGRTAHEMVVSHYSYDLHKQSLIGTLESL